MTSFYSSPRIDQGHSCFQWSCSFIYSLIQFRIRTFFFKVQKNVVQQVSFCGELRITVWEKSPWGWRALVGVLLNWICTLSTVPCSCLLKHPLRLHVCVNKGKWDTASGFMLCHLWRGLGCRTSQELLGCAYTSHIIHSQWYAVEDSHATRRFTKPDFHSWIFLV